MDDISNLKKLATEAMKKLADGEKFFTGKLAIRLSKAAQSYPGDATIVQMATFLNKRAASPNGYLITRAELKNLYDRLYTLNTKCASILSEELDMYTQKDTVKRMAHSESEGKLIDYDKYVDPIMAKELRAVFDKEASYAPYSDSVAKQAEDACRRVLGPQPKIKAVDGRDFAILCSASFDTPKGKVDVMIPVEVVNSQALLPTVFLSTAGFVDINRDNLSKHIVNTAGKQFRVNAEQLFQVIKVAKFGVSAPEIDPVEHAVMMLHQRTKKAEVNIDNAIVLQELVPADVKREDLPEAKSFSEYMGTVAGSAEFVFSKKAVDMAHNMILNDLLTFGYKNPIIKLNTFKDDTITYMVSIGGAGFKIPVKVKEGKALPPNMIFANGGMESFTREGVKQALGTGDLYSSSVALGYSLDHPAQMIEMVRTACLAKDYTKASEVISAINASGDRKALAYAFGIYTDALSGNLKEAQAEKKVPTIKVAGQEVCAQTYLPVDQVYLDENGVSQPKFRKNAEKTEQQAAYFMQQKILLG